MTMFRRSIVVVFVGILFLSAVPFISRADTATDQSQLIALLRQLILVLQAQLQQILLAKQPQNVAPPVHSTPESTLSPALDLLLPPTCQLKIDLPSVDTGGNWTLWWGAPGAITGTISDIGEVLPIGLQLIPPGQTTSYDGIFTGPGGTAVCTSSINVKVPANTIPDSAISF